MIVFSCRCGKRLKATEEDAGRRAKCPVCLKMVVIPGPAAGSTKVDESPSAEASRADSLRRRAALDAFARGLSAADKP